MQESLGSFPHVFQAQGPVALVAIQQDMKLRQAVAALATLDFNLILRVMLAECLFIGIDNDVFVLALTLRLGLRLLLHDAILALSGLVEIGINPNVSDCRRILTRCL